MCIVITAKVCNCFFPEIAKLSLGYLRVCICTKLVCSLYKFSANRVFIIDICHSDKSNPFNRSHPPRAM